MTRTKNMLAVIATILMVISCTSHPDIPQTYETVSTQPNIYPDYRDVTVPPNIAPLNFMAEDSLCTRCIARITAPDGSVITYGTSNKILIPQDEWNTLVRASLGKSLQVEVFTETRGKWTCHAPFGIHIAKEEIDPHVSYRLIEPSYGLYDQMNISQRNVTNFDEEVIFNNKVACDDRKGQCINCHSYQNYHTDNMLFHVRVTHGGTVFVVDGKPHMADLNRENTISAGVYPSWHPTEKFVAFSTDLTHQWFHTSNVNKVEVFDDASDLILYDVQKQEVTNIAADPDRMEVFPTWSGDGKWLYYCSGDTWKPDTLTGVTDFRFGYKDLKYNIYRRSFDAKTRQFGPEQLVYDAVSQGRSCSLPRISPDSKYLAFAEGDYGYFNIWHHEADIRILQIEGAEASADSLALNTIPTTEMNTKGFAESYPSFSSNGKWVMCASRRDDGNYSRIYFAYFDGKRTHKAFLLPQQDPEHNMYRLKSYNRPEFMVEPVKVSIPELTNLVLGN